MPRSSIVEPRAYAIDEIRAFELQVIIGGNASASGTYANRSVLINKNIADSFCRIKRHANEEARHDMRGDACWRKRVQQARVAAMLVYSTRRSRKYDFDVSLLLDSTSVASSRHTAYSQRCHRRPWLP